MKKIALVTIFTFLTAVGMPLITYGAATQNSSAGYNRSYNGRNDRPKQYRGKKGKRRRKAKRHKKVKRNSSYRSNYRSNSNYNRSRNNGNYSNGRIYRPRRGVVVYRDNRSTYRRHRNVTNIAIASGTGAVVGGILGGKKGALIGAGIGAGAGAIYTYGINPKNKRRGRYSRKRRY